MILRCTPGSPEQAINQGYITPQLPIFFDLSSDPHEDFNALDHHADHGLGVLTNATGHWRV
jgi:hypothetical protein